MNISRVNLENDNRPKDTLPRARYEWFDVFNIREEQDNRRAHVFHGSTTRARSTWTSISRIYPPRRTTSPSLDV